jgi:hypothetical protein
MFRTGPPVLWRAASIAIAVLALTGMTGCGRLDRDAVSTDLKTLVSSTGEGMLVAEQAAAARAPTSFIDIRTAELAKQSRNAADALTETPTESGLQDAARRGAEIGSRAEELLDSLHSDPGNTGLATNVTRGLRDLHDQAGRVEGSL